MKFKIKFCESAKVHLDKNFNAIDLKDAIEKTHRMVVDSLGECYVELDDEEWGEWTIKAYSYEEALLGEGTLSW